MFRHEQVVADVDRDDIGSLYHVFIIFQRVYRFVMSNDDEAFVSQSSAEYLESPNKAKMKALKDKLKKQGIKVAADKQGDLKALKLALLKGQVADKNDTKTADESADAKGTAQGTKTREQQISSAKLGADTKQSADQIVAQNQQDEKAEDALKEDEVQSEDA